MRRGLRQATSIALLTVTALACGLGGRASADVAGSVHFVRSADSSFDSFTSSASLETQAWLRAHMWRMIVWSPFFDDKTAWYPQGWMYDDAYAIYPESSLASQHPEWILRDTAGNKLFIPYGCGNGTCPQYAGDISNPAFRHYWIEQARGHLAHGYRGLFVDDVNMEERVGDASETDVAPVGAGGAVITPAAWRAYMAQFMAEIRAALPAAEIVHNALWFANADAGPSDPSIRREIESANYILLERGVNDSGLTGGSGRWSLNALLAFVDQVHSLGRGVVMDGSASDPRGMEYNLASYFEISTGNDAVSAKEQTPTSWWQGFNVNLGEATNARHPWSNLLRRDFTGGMVLVNPPGSATQTITLPNAMRDASGSWVSSLTLSPASGAVLSGTVQGSPSSAAEAGAAVTRTTLETRLVGTRHGSKARRAPAGLRGRKRSRGPSSHARGRQHGRHAKGHAARRLARARHGGGPLARISGVVRRATRGSVVIKVEVRRHGRWIAARRIALSVNPAGRFFSLLRLRAGARYRVSATYTGSAGYRPSWSGYRLLALRAR
jgi:Hypothetical glycosyl hydrolase family 15